MVDSSEWVNVPLEGVKISVDGIEDVFTVTDMLGDFRLEDAPAGRFFVHIDGTTATNEVPEGAYYPRVGKAWESIPGEEINIGDVYLPLVASNTLRPVSMTEETVITFPSEIIAERPHLAGLTVTVPPDVLFSDDGTRGGQIGIARVQPDRLPGALPEGLEIEDVVTVQTDGATNFDRPVPVCFPNKDNLQPGAKSALWSFNHDSGRWEVIGPMTVTDDGKFVCSDPKYGLRWPGWHGQRAAFQSVVLG